MKNLIHKLWLRTTEQGKRYDNDQQMLNRYTANQITKETQNIEFKPKHDAASTLKMLTDSGMSLQGTIDNEFSKMFLHCNTDEQILVDVALTGDLIGIYRQINFEQFQRAITKNKTSYADLAAHKLNGLIKSVQATLIASPNAVNATFTQEIVNRLREVVISLKKSENDD